MPLLQIVYGLNNFPPHVISDAPREYDFVMTDNSFTYKDSKGTVYPITNVIYAGP
jgi:hypothetical protein